MMPLQTPVLQGQGTTALLPPTAEPSAPECPFCGDVFSPDHITDGTAWGICHRCSEMVAVEVEFQW